jgi:hypothetical protein
MADGTFRSTAKVITPGPTRVEILRRALIPLEEIEVDLESPHRVKGWLDRGAFSAVYGPSNVGKTFFAADMGGHVAAGRDWYGCRVASPCDVLYVAAEGGRGFKKRLAALWREKPDLCRAARGRFHLLPMPLNLSSRADAEALIEVARGLGWDLGLVIADTLARSMGSGDENSSTDMGAFIASVDLIRAATGAHVMAIHHTGKDASKGLRGHSALLGAVDTSIEISREGGVITAEAKKQRDMETGQTFSYTLQPVTLGQDQDGDDVRSCVVQPTDAPVKRAPKLTGQAAIAMQAFGDALAHHGVIKTGDMFPPNRQCVPLERWREYCDRLSLSSGETATAKRTAFFKAKAALQEKGVVCVVDDYAWRVAE